MNRLILTLFFFAALHLHAQDRDGKDFHLDKEFPIASNGTLTLRTSDAKVSIRGTDRSNARIIIDHKVITKGIAFGEQRFDVAITPENGNLRVIEKSQSEVVGFIGYHEERYTVTIEIPNHVTVDIQGDDGDYQIHSVHGQVRMDVDDADVTLTQCKGNYFSFRIDDGDIRMDEGRGKLEVNADDTDVIVNQGAFTDIQARLDDGDFIIETTLVEKGDYDVSAQDGRIAMTILGDGGRFDIRHDDSRVKTEGNFSIVEQSEDRTRVKCGNGMAIVHINADDASIRLSTK